MLNIIAGSLMILSGGTHISQIFLKVKRKTLPVVAGFIYFMLGILLILNFSWAIFIGAILPFLGGIGGLYHYLKIEKVKLILFHLLIDVIVVIISMIIIIK